jgi:hypothetical protein
MTRGEGSEAEELRDEGDRELSLLEEMNMGELGRKRTGVFCKKNARLASH